MGSVKEIKTILVRNDVGATGGYDKHDSSKGQGQLVNSRNSIINSCGAVSTGIREGMDGCVLIVIPLLFPIRTLRCYEGGALLLL